MPKEATMTKTIQQPSYVSCGGEQSTRPIRAICGGGNSLMRNVWKYSYRVLFVSSLALALSGVGASARAQQNPTMSTSGAANAEAQANPNPDLTTQEVARMDQFL